MKTSDSSTLASSKGRFMVEKLTWVDKDDETSCIEMAVPAVLPGSLVEEVHDNRGM